MPDNATARKITIGCRYPVDRVGLLDVIGGRLGFPDRAENIRAALDFWIERHIPGALSRQSESQASADPVYLAGLRDAAKNREGDR